MITTNLKRSVGALAVTAGLLAAAAPASHAFPLTSGHQYGNAHVVAPPPNTVPASTSLNTLGGDDTVTAKRAKAKHGKGKVAHGNQRTGTILNADVKTWINQSETMSSNLERGARGRRGGPRWPASAAHPARVAG